MFLKKYNCSMLCILSILLINNLISHPITVGCTYMHYSIRDYYVVARVYRTSPDSQSDAEYPARSICIQRKYSPLALRVGSIKIN